MLRYSLQTGLGRSFVALKLLIKNLGRFQWIVPALFISAISAFAQNAEIQWSEAAVSYDESAGTVDITLTRSGNLSGLARVFYRSVEVSATSGFDYQAISSRQALFTSGKEELQISVRISQDALEEGDETFLLQLFNPGTGVTIGSRKDLQITILDDETGRDPIN